MGRYLEVADFPEQEIRNQLGMLEQLYEKHFQRPLMDKEDSLFRLLQQVRDSEIEFSATIARLQESYEDRYQPEANQAMEHFLARLDSLNASADDYERCIDELRQHYTSRFGVQYRNDTADLRAEVCSLAEETATCEREMQEQLIGLTRLIVKTQEGLARINEMRDRLSN